jgi:predicted nucleic acid-binding protein
MTDEPGVSRGLADTSVIIDLQQLRGKLPNELAISAVTLAELSTGLYTTDDPVTRVQRQLRLQWVEATFQCLPFDAEAARVHGSLSGLVVAMGRNPGRRIGDIQIAATAVRNGITLYTRNPDDFSGLESLLHVVGV